MLVSLFVVKHVEERRDLPLERSHVADHDGLLASLFLVELASHELAH